jgi:hypothetical protein
MGLKQISCEHQDWIQIAENTPFKDLNLIIFTYNLLSVFIFGILQTHCHHIDIFQQYIKQNKIMHPNKLCTCFMNSLQPNYHMSSYK